LRVDPSVLSQKPSFKILLIEETTLRMSSRSKSSDWIPTNLWNIPQKTGKTGKTGQIKESY